MGQTVLEMTGIKKSFAGIYALNGIDFSLELGEVYSFLLIIKSLFQYTYIFHPKRDI